MSIQREEEFFRRSSTSRTVEDVRHPDSSADPTTGPMDSEKSNIVNPFDAILWEIAAIHEKKNHDYTGEGGDRAENFIRASMIVEWFDNPIDQVFATLFGVKLARLASLYNDSKNPKNEPTDDSHLDFDTYAVIWHEVRRRFTHHEELIEYYMRYRRAKKDSRL